VDNLCEANQGLRTIELEDLSGGGDEDELEEELEELEDVSEVVMIFLSTMSRRTS
jgi:hypothetical protein